jgi:TctA family transporter
MGIEQLADGFDFRLVVLPGLRWVADGMICIVSPALMLATYMGRIAGWHDPKVAAIAAACLRVVAALVIGASCWLTIGQLGAWGVGALLAFGVLGIACKLLTWSRPALLIGFACSWFLEEKLKAALVLSRGDAAIVLRSALSTTLLAATAIVLVVAMALSLRRAFAQGTRAA